MEKIYLGRDNTIDRQIKSDGTPLTAEQVGAITRGVAVLDDDNIFDSDTIVLGDGQPFDNVARASEGAIRLQLGHQDITPGQYRCQLTVYDVLNDDGIYFGSFDVQVQQLIDPA